MLVKAEAKGQAQDVVYHGNNDFAMLKVVLGSHAFSLRAVRSFCSSPSFVMFTFFSSGQHPTEVFVNAPARQCHCLVLFDFVFLFHFFDHQFSR